MKNPNLAKVIGRATAILSDQSQRIEQASQKIERADEAKIDALLALLPEADQKTARAMLDASELAKDA